MKMKFLVLFAILVSPLCAFSNPDPDLLMELHDLQSRSKSGVIHINDRSVKRFLSSSNAPRPYYLLVFFDAIHLHDKSELHLKQFHHEFNLVASTFIAKTSPDPSSGPELFFCYLEFNESERSFFLFGVETLPHIRLVAPDVTDLRDSERMGQSDSSQAAESIVEFVESTTRFTVGPIRRPPVLSRAQAVLLVVVVVAWSPFVARRVWAGDTFLHDSKIWLTGAVLVYFFSVSGAMHNIIRKTPMFLVDGKRMAFFYQGTGVQLGAEGFAVGFLYTAVGLMLAVVTHLLVRVRNASAQRGVMLFMLLVSLWAVRKVVMLDNWKTGYAIHAYWPSTTFTR